MPQGFYGLQTHPNGAVTPLDEPRVAAAKAEHLAAHGGSHEGSYGYEQSFYGLVAHPNGAVVPVDEPAVQAARADHLSIKGVESGLHKDVYNGLSHSEVAYKSYNGPIHIPTLVAHPNGAVTPADEPAVQAARAEHLAAYGEVYKGESTGAYATPYAYEQSFYGLVAHPNGAVVPVDEPAVQAARAEHLNAKAANGH